MGVKHHYQQHSNYVISRQVSSNDGENWSTLTSFKLTKLYHMMYTVHLYTIPKRTLARQHTFGYAGFIWYCQAPVIVCWVKEKRIMMHVFWFFFTDSKYHMYLWKSMMANI